ncbi:hypothetical protein BW737_014380, partial [Actinomyces ruminis]
PGEHLDAATADRLVGDLLHAGAASAPATARGVLLVTHRLSALADADEVLVLGLPGGADNSPDADGAGGSLRLTPATVTRRGTHAHLAVVDPEYRWSLEQEQETHV